PHATREAQTPPASPRDGGTAMKGSAMTATSPTVNTVLGPVPADDLGVVAVHEALLSVVPGAEHAYDLSLDRAEVFAILTRKLAAFRNQGGRTIVDSTGMFHGRDVRL